MEDNLELHSYKSTDTIPQDLDSLKVRYVFNQVNFLDQRVSGLEDKQQPTCIQLEYLRSSVLKLKKALNVAIDRENSDYTATCFDLDIYGVGDTDQEAIEDLSENIEELFFVLKEEGESNLGPKMLGFWRYLNSVIIEENAA